MNSNEIEQLLLERWGHLTILGDDHSMSPDKLRDRVEDARHEHPFIFFDIERHGATVNGSIYAEVHSWRVNLESNEAEVIAIKRRQLHAKSKVLDVKPLARQIADAIMNRVEDVRLKWLTQEKVRVLVNEVIPETNKQTTSSRRKRFRTELNSLLSGWEQSSPNVYVKVKS